MADNHFVKDVQFIRARSGRRTIQRPHGLRSPLRVVRMWKSSLINRLVNRKQIARVSNTPGRTPLLNFFLVNNAFVLCDLPGYGFAKVPVKIKGMGPHGGNLPERAAAGPRSLLLMDVRRTPGDWEMQLIQWASLHGAFDSRRNEGRQALRLKVGLRWQKSRRPSEWPQTK